MKRTDVIYVSKNKFNGALLKEYFKNYDLSYYFLDDENETSYIFKDLCPKVVLISEDFCESCHDVLSYIPSEIDVKKVFIGSNEKEGFDYNWPLQIDLENLSSKIKDLIK
ncbi:MAG: hypothetical protein N4A33_01440 [Bacteriovoracaceae bacterium]|nr:hypothetical protein [Bacteriovoracaceae bacterium]